MKRRSLITIFAMLAGGLALIPAIGGIGGATPQKCYVFTSNYNGNSISIIDPITYTVDTSITTAAGQPSGLSLSPDGETLYVAERFGDHVEVFDVATKASIGTVPIGSTTNDVIVSPNGGIAAVVKTDWGASSIVFFSLATNTITGSVTIPVDATNAAFTPDGTEVWVNSVDSGTVAVFAIAPQISSSFDITHSNPGAPYTGTTGIRFSPAGDFAYIGNAADGMISVVDTSTYAEITTITIGHEPGAMDFSPDGTKALVVIEPTKSIGFIDTNTHTLTTTLDVTTLGYDFPTDAVFSPDGSQVIFSAEGAGDDKVVFLDLASSTVAGDVTVPQGINRIADIVCGNLDVTFGDYGFVTTNFSTQDVSGDGIASDSSGRIIHVGTCEQPISKACVVRYNADGSLDTSFGTGGKVILTIGASSSVSIDLIVKDDGKILLTGHCNQGSPGNENICLIQLNDDGTLDTSFQTTGIVDVDVGTEVDVGLAVLIDSTGLIYVSGYCQDVVGGIFNGCIIRFTADGALDATYAGDGIANFTICDEVDYLYDMSIDDSDNVLVSVGCFPLVNNLLVAKVTKTGVLDNSFGTAGVASADYNGTDSFSMTVDIDGDGSILVSGACDSREAFCVAKFTQDGLLDTTFGTNGFWVDHLSPGSDISNELVIDPLGRIVLGGTCGDVYFCIARITAGGFSDASFDDDGYVRFDIESGADVSTTMMIDANGDIIVGDEDKLIMIRSGSEHDTEYYITIEKVR